MAGSERNVAIVGAGLIGRAWAAIFARAGWNVRLTDPHAQGRAPPDPR
jgi:3-hydroxyacyl-CoA dehydrogenase